MVRDLERYRQIWAQILGLQLTRHVRLSFLILESQFSVYLLEHRYLLFKILEKISATPLEGPVEMVIVLHCLLATMHVGLYHSLKAYFKSSFSCEASAGSRPV